MIFLYYWNSNLNIFLIKLASYCYYILININFDIPKWSLGAIITIIFDFINSIKNNKKIYNATYIKLINIFAYEGLYLILKDEYSNQVILSIIYIMYYESFKFQYKQKYIIIIF